VVIWELLGFTRMFCVVNRQMQDFSGWLIGHARWLLGSCQGVPGGC